MAVLHTKHLLASLTNWHRIGCADCKDIRNVVGGFDGNMSARTAKERPGARRWRCPRIARLITGVSQFARDRDKSAKQVSGGA
jgi:hypothetical protein